MQYFLQGSDRGLLADIYYNVSGKYPFPYRNAFRLGWAHSGFGNGIDSRFAEALPLLSSEGKTRDSAGKKIKEPMKTSDGDKIGSFMSRDTDDLEEEALE